MNKAIFSGLAIALIAGGPAFAADMPVKAPVAAAPTCRLPGSMTMTAFECPGFSFSLGAMAIHRETTERIVVTPPTGTPGTIVTGDDFNFRWAWSPDLIARYRFGGGWSVEGRYFYSHPSDATFDIANITTFRTAGIGVTILGGGPLNSIYSSRFDSAEFSVWKELVPGISVGAGYRHFNMHDVLRVNMNTPATFVNWDDTNKLDGAQLGASFAFVTPSIPLHFTATVKGGIYHNSASNAFSSTIVGSSLNNAATKQAVSAEADLTATYYVTDRLSLSANYMALWLKDVALPDAAAQTTTQVAGGTSSPVAFNKVWYNAVSVRVGYDF